MLYKNIFIKNSLKIHYKPILTVGILSVTIYFNLPNISNLLKGASKIDIKADVTDNLTAEHGYSTVKHKYSSATNNYIPKMIDVFLAGSGKNQPSYLTTSFVNNVPYEDNISELIHKFFDSTGSNQALQLINQENQSFSLQSSDENLKAEISKLKEQVLQYQNENQNLSASLIKSNEQYTNLLSSSESFKKGAVYLSQKYEDFAYAFDLDKAKVVPLSKNISSGKIKLNTSHLLSRTIPLGTIFDSPAILTSRYGERNVEGHPSASKKHKGIDFASNIGTPIYAPANAIVSLVRPSTSKRGSGNFILLDHAMGFSSSYSHLSKFSVKAGQIVQEGDLIGFTGDTGYTTGPHLHYEIKHNKKHIDPLPLYNFSRGDNVAELKDVDGVDWGTLLVSYEDSSLVSAIIYRL